MSQFYDEDDSLLRDDQIEQLEEETQYDDDETFGDSGPLNNEWENQHMSLASEHENLVSDLGIRDSIKHYNRDDGELLEEEDDDDYNNNNNNNNHKYNHHNGHKGEKILQDTSAFFSTDSNGSTPSKSSGTSNVNTANTPSRKVGMFSSLSLYDQNQQHQSNQNDDEMESMFKMAMGENYKPPPQHIPAIPIPTPNNSYNSVPIVPEQPQQPQNESLKLLFQNAQAGSSLPKADSLKGAYSLSDIEAKLESQTQSPQQQQQPQVVTPEKQHFKKNRERSYSGQKQQQQQQQYSSSPGRGFTLGDMIPGNKEYQQQQQQLREQAKEANWSQHSAQLDTNGVAVVHSPSHTPEKQYQNRYQNKQQNGKSPHKQYHNNNGLQDKKYMTAEEIQSIHRLQAYQLHYTNPYIEDFYYQKLKLRSINNVPIHSHTPICDSNPKIMTKKPTTNPTGAVDPLSTALGRIPSHSLRAPRPILQIILDKDDNEQYDKTVQSSDQTIKLAIESSFNHLLDIEDIDQLINSPQAAESQLMSDYQQKREAVSQELFKSLHLDPYPCFKYEAPVLPQQLPDQKWPSVCPEDLLFVSLWVIGKGRKLLNRAFLSLTGQQSVSGLFAICRNLPLLLMLHMPDGAEQATSGIYHTTARWVMEVPIPFFNLAFHFLVNFNQPQFICKLFNSRYGLSIIEKFLLRGYMIQDPGYLMHNQITVDPVNVLQWHEIFGRFFQRLSGNFSTLFSPLFNNNNQINNSPQSTEPPAPELTQIHALLFHHANESQRNILGLEMSTNKTW